MSATRTLELLNECASDLVRIADDLRWAHANGYWPAATGEPGTSLAKPEDEREKGPLLDFGIGDHASRQAFGRAVERLAEAERELDAAVVLVGVQPQQPMKLRPTDRTPMHGLLLVVAGLRWRAAVLGYDLGSPSAMAPDKAERAIAKAAKALQRCVSSLARALDRGPTRTTEEIPMCVTCLVRPRRQARGRVIGKECDTCHRWRALHNGQARPRELDTGDLEEARQAAARRREQGLGWGVA